MIKVERKDRGLKINSEKNHTTIQQSASLKGFLYRGLIGICTDKIVIKITFFWKGNIIIP